MLFADDTQLYLVYDKAVQECTRVEKCIDDVWVWIADNRLVLNDSKTGVIHFHPRFRKNAELISNLRVGVTLIKPCSMVRDLVVHIDDLSTMFSHVSRLAASFSLYRIGRIRRLLDDNTIEKLVHAFITSRYDYSNSLLYGIDEQHLDVFKCFNTLLHAWSHAPSTSTSLLYSLTCIGFMSMHELKSRFY